jgi:hypothetical protein
LYPCYGVPEFERFGSHPFGTVRHLADIMTIRFKDRDKEALSFSSKMTGIPASKLLYPFISEAIRINLGAALLFNVDRNTPYQRAKYGRFVEALKDHETRLQSETPPSMETILESTPRVVQDFFWMFREVKAAERIESAMGDIQLSLDMGFLNASFLRTLCISLADAYVSRGLSLSRIEVDQTRRIFFHLMTSHLYRNNAKGTARAISVKWYSHQDLVNKLVDEMVSRYELRYPAKVVEAIEVREAIPVVTKQPIIRTVPAKVIPAISTPGGK